MTLRPRFVGALEALAPADRRLLVERSLSELEPEVMSRARAIVDAVKREGDAALRRLTLELDGASLERFEVPRAALVAALDAVPAPFRRALERSLANIERVHRAFLPVACETEVEPGIVVGRRPDALSAVGGLCARRARRLSEQRAHGRGAGACGGGSARSW
jgi:histidinol dehydrogenase